MLRHHVLGSRRCSNRSPSALHDGPSAAAAARKLVAALDDGEGVLPRRHLRRDAVQSRVQAARSGQVEVAPAWWSRLQYRDKGLPTMN
jgi:hypothetical protein